MSDERPDALLKSALEKIVWFEARSSQVTGDLSQSRGEVERLKAELAQAAQREIELRRVVAELEVRLTRAHSEREEFARAVDALKRERTELIGKMLDASRIQGAGTEQEVDTLDLASFISQLRAEVVASRGGVAAPTVPAPAPMPVPVTAPTPRAPSAVEAVAQGLKAEGRLTVSARELETLENAQPFPGRAEETLFGFSVRELAAPDPAARLRAAERLKALGHEAAAPALATALHGETEPTVLVALLGAVAAVAHAQMVPVVQPLLTSSHPDVRIAALKALLTLDPGQAGPHLTAAVRDPDKAVRRRASLLALGLKGDAALELGTLGIQDDDADVRSLAALVLGASGAETARGLLLDALKDRDARVRRSAGQALSRVLGHDVMGLVDLDDSQRRREVRRLALLPVRPVQGSVSALDRVREKLKGARREAAGPSANVAVPAASVANASTAPVSERSAARPGITADQSMAPGRHEMAPAQAAPVAASSWPGSTAEQPMAPAPSAPAFVQVVARPGSTSDQPAAYAAPGWSAEHSPSAAPVGAHGAAHALAPAARVAVVDAAPSEALLSLVLGELRSSIRGRPLDELARTAEVPLDEARAACAALMARGQAVRRGLKYFVA